MSNKFDFSGKLDFSDIDLTAPEKVIGEILSQLPEATNDIIHGKIQPYNGAVFSYKKVGIYGIAEALGTTEKTVDIQHDLGKIGQETHKFECFLYTPEYEKYKYRVFFAKYDLSNYPVSIILDESVANSISASNSGYVYTCNTREELETLIYKVFASKRIITVMQELIHINQAKKEEQKEWDSAGTEEVE